MFLKGVAIALTYIQLLPHIKVESTLLCLEDFKETILQTFPSQATDDDSSLVDETDIPSNEAIVG